MNSVKISHTDTWFYDESTGDQFIERNGKLLTHLRGNSVTSDMGFQLIYRTMRIKELESEVLQLNNSLYNIKV